MFILPEIAMVGDCTILNAGPNHGQNVADALATRPAGSGSDEASQHLLRSTPTIHSTAATKHLRIYYINADDSFNGGIEKMEILKGQGITTLIPNQNGFDPANLAKIIKAAHQSRRLRRRW